MQGPSQSAARVARACLLLLPLLAEPAFGATRARASTAANDTAVIASAPGATSRDALNAFLRQLDRAEELYRALMFEEADRISELTVMRINAFLESHRHLSGVDEVEAVLQARTAQLRELRSLLEHDRALEEQRSAERYDRLKAERERRRQAYQLALEQRRAAEARAARWWPIWFGRPLILRY